MLDIPRVFPVPDSLEKAYHGAGWALAAVTGGRLAALRYIEDVAPKIAEAIDAADGAHAGFFVRQWLDPAEAGAVVRELSALGEVSIGMCSSWEFTEL
jgi:hypothetical protein